MPRIIRISVPGGYGNPLGTGSVELLLGVVVTVAAEGSELMVVVGHDGGPACGIVPNRSVRARRVLELAVE